MGTSVLSVVGDTDTVAVEIESIAAGGDGVGRLDDGRVAFVPRAAPGDRLRVRLTQEKPRFVRAEIVEVLEASPARRTPPCPLYERCGGCQVQHLEPQAQRRARARVVRDALNRLGSFDVDVPETLGDEREFGYRNRVSFAVRRIRSAATGETRVVAGYHDRERPGRIVDVHDECLLAAPQLLEVWQELRASWGQGARRLPAGASLRLTLRSVDEGVVLLIEGGKGSGTPSELVEQVSGLVSVWHQPQQGAARCVAGLEQVHDQWFGERITLRGSSFLQVNRPVAELLHRHVIEQLEAQPGHRVIDAYCGIGLYARQLAAAGCAVIGIELDSHAAREAMRSCGPDCRIVQGRTEDHLARVLPADRVIVNPPRGGLDVQVIEQLNAQPVPRWVYVSCDPATLARDLGRCSDLYEIRRVLTFDLFPQTAHVETVVTLDLRHDSQPDGA